LLKVEELIVDGSATVLETMKKLDETGQRILFVAPGGKLEAVVTDGDLRKFFLRGGTLNEPVSRAANYHPKSLTVAERGRARAELQKYEIDALPILNARGVITDIVFAKGLDVDNRKRAGIPVVIMAGGLGTRLYPYTKILPKPLIPVGEMPIAELIINRFRDFGCQQFTMVVNYKKNMIKSYFNDLEKDYTVGFADEDTFMGTGGGLCLLKGRMDSTFFFTNCDTLLDVDFGDLYEHHKKQGNLITMVCAFKHFTVPYGVVEMGTDGGITAMKEKPELNFLTNTGVYVVEPRVVAEMPIGQKMGFPDVIERYRKAGEKVGVYPIAESSWMDMGQMEELEKMRRRLESQN
jgi:dTDP-glucose pyrophosphorylase